MYATIFLLLVGSFAASAELGSAGEILKCYKCDSIEDCKQDLEVEETCTNVGEECMIQFNADNVPIKQGCLDKISKSSCKEPNCYQCTQNKCNNPKNCKTCNSVNLLSCAQKPEEVDDIKCSSNSGCFVRINTAGHTERGCWDDLKEEDKGSCKNDETCTHSFTRHLKVFPENRLTCLQCENMEACKTPSSSIEGLACKLKTTTECYETYTNNTIKRGCLESSELCKDKAVCKTCKTKDCNRTPADKIAINSSNKIILSNMLFCAVFLSITSALKI